MTPLAREIAAAIAADGPMPVDRYMALCLSHPAYGYYATRDPFGRGGDFVTAPEISQMFGELLGLWVAEVWMGMGAPSRVALVELGPGRGTLMADMLRAAKAAPGFLQAVEVTLVETSPTLAEIQADALARTGVMRRWVRRVEDALGSEDRPPSPLWGGVGGGGGSEKGERADAARRLTTTPRSEPPPPSPSPQGGGSGYVAPAPEDDPGSAVDAAAQDDAGALPVIVVANEFFDALPIRQFVRTRAGWRERLVGLDEAGRLVFGLSPGAPDLALADAPEGSVREISPQALEVASVVARHIAAAGGAMLAIDYGHATGFGDTLQAMKAHAYADPLAAPGEADLTAHVDFGALAAAATGAGAQPMRLLPQAELLERLGLWTRAEALSRASPNARDQILADAARLVDRAPRGMGGLFKALAVCDPRAPAPPAFDPIHPRG